MTEKKKGVHPLAWVGIGCLVVAMIGIAIVALLIGKCTAAVKDFTENPEKAAAWLAERAIKDDPDYEFVSRDDENRTITYIEKATGKEITVSWDDIRDGKLTVLSGDEKVEIDASGGKVQTTGPDGTTTIGGDAGLKNLPQWFDMPEGIDQWRSAMHREKADGTFAGSVAGRSNKSLAGLQKEFEESLERAGFTREARSETQNHSMLNYRDETKKRTINVTLFAQQGHTGVNVGYEQK